MTKKSVLFLATASAMAFASCSNDEVVELNNGGEISFRSVMGMPNTRGAELTNANLDQLGNLIVSATLDGEEYFTDQEFELKSGFYFSANKYYWPGDDRELTFNVKLANQAGIIGSAYTPAADWSNHVDVLYASNVTSKKSLATNGVEIPFQHAMSQIQIQAKNSAEGRYVIEVVNTKIANVNGTGTYVLGTGWTEVGTPATYTLGANYAVQTLNKTSATNLMGANGNAMLIPQTLTAWNGKAGEQSNKGAYIGLLVKITTQAGAHVYPAKNAGVEYAWVAVPVDTEWLAGKKYVYTLTFGEGAGLTDPDGPTVNPVLDGEIKLDVNVSDWTDGFTGNEGNKTF